MNTRHSFNLTMNLYGKVTQADKEYVAGKILAAVETEKECHGITQDDNENIEAGSIVSCEPISDESYVECKPSGNVVNYTNLGMKIVEVKSRFVLDEISNLFDVFTRSEVSDEIILDCTILDGNAELASKLFDILCIKSEHELAQDLPSEGFVVFHC
jgi:hypothetical protein